jgi:hypothetical protein
MTTPFHSDILTGWHPLSGQPAPDYVPERWDGPHVGVRLVEALRVLRRMPMNGSPREFGNAWPSYGIEFVDASSFADDPQWKADQAAMFNQVRPRPSAAEIAHMETAIVWPARYLSAFPQLLRTVGTVALVRSMHRDIDYAARRRLRLPARVVRKWNREGLDKIAAGLRRDAVSVF